MKHITIVLLLLALTGCPGNIKPDPGNPVAVTACPEQLPALTDDTFGGTVAKLIEVAGVYYKCRASAVGAQNLTSTPAR